MPFDDLPQNLMISRQTIMCCCSPECWLSLQIDSIDRVRSGHGKSGKSMDFVFENSRPGNSMEVDEKFWKEVESFGKFLFRKGCFLFFRAGA